MITTEITFPELSVNVRRNGGYAMSFVDQVIKANMDGGYEARRPRNSRRLHEFHLSYELPRADKLVLIEFIDNVVFGTALPFNWVDPVTGQSYIVRFNSLPQIKYMMPDGEDDDRWDATFDLGEF